MEATQSLAKLRQMNDHYHGIGLVTGIFGLEDEPGVVEPMHRHGAARIFVIAGSVELTLEGQEPRAVVAGDELIIQERQGHQVTVGPESWLYLFARDAAEAEAQGITAQVS